MSFWAACSPKPQPAGPQQLEHKLLAGRAHALSIIWHQSLAQRPAHRHRQSRWTRCEAYPSRSARCASSGMLLKASLLSFPSSKMRIRAPRSSLGGFREWAESAHAPPSSMRRALWRPAPAAGSQTAPHLQPQAPLVTSSAGVRGSRDPRVGVPSFLPPGITRWETCSHEHGKGPALALVSPHQSTRKQGACDGL